MTQTAAAAAADWSLILQDDALPGDLEVHLQLDPVIVGDANHGLKEKESSQSNQSVTRCNIPTQP